MDETIYFKDKNKMRRAIIMPIFGPNTERILELTGFVISFRGLTKVNPPKSVNFSASIEAAFSM